MDGRSNIAILILAAGESSRMEHRVKQLLPWEDTTLLGHALKQAESAVAAETFVVLGAYHEEIIATLKLNQKAVIHNPNWNEGLGSSIATGIRHFESKQQNFDAVLIMLADQPLIDTDYINLMIQQWESDISKMITTQYRNRSGVPALFSKDHFDTLKKLNKDFGAKHLIASHKDAILAINPDGKEIDIDHWETYQEFIKSKN